jgi:hypothetical protein
MDMKPTRKAIAVSSPIGVTVLLALWTAAVYPYSRYGDAWAIWPALIALPIVLGLHTVLIMRYRPRSQYWAYALAHGVLFLPLWIGALMLISKDSL